MKKINELLFSPSYSMNVRLFLLGGIMGTIAMFAAFVASIISSEGFYASLAILFGTLFTAAVIYYSIKYNKVNVGATIIVIMSNCLLIPYGYMMGGGVYSGSSAWFIMGFVIVFLFFKGKRFYFFYILTLISFATTTYISYIHPEYVISLETREGIYFDQFIAPLLVATAVGVLQHYQGVILEKEAKLSDKQHKEIEELNAAQNAFFSSMSHEIRTPINTIIGLNETTLRNNDLPEDVVENSINIQNASRMLLSLINDILDLSKIQSGRMELTEAQYETSRMFSEIVNLLWNRAREKGLQFNINVGENIPSMLYGDEMRIKQVIINLLTNAIKYTDEGSVTLTIDGEKTQTNGFLLRIAVADTGQGIRRENIHVIFDSFKRVEGKENKMIEGTGLGLSITKQLVDLMGGQITVDSIYTKGSTFRVSIPQRIVSEVPINFKSISESNRELEHYQQSFEAPEARVLIVDDNDMNRMVCQKLLRETKVKIDVAASGKECLELTLQHHYDAIFMDHEMPDLDGIETLRRLRSQTNGLCHDAPVVALTANAGSDRNSFYIDHGFQAYLAKPIHGSLLEATLMQLLPTELIENVRSTKEEDVIQILQNAHKKDIIVATDSACDLPRDILKYYDIRVISNYIVTKDGRFRDYEEIDADNLHQYLLEEGKEIRTEAASVDEYEEFFGQLLSEAEEVIHLSATPILSEGFKNATLASQSFNNVKVVNSGQLSAGLGMLAVKVAQLAIRGKEVEEILSEIDEYEDNIVNNFLVPSVEMINRRFKINFLMRFIALGFNGETCFSIKKKGIKLKRYFIGYLNEVIWQYIRFNFSNKRNIDNTVLYLVYAGYSAEERNNIVNEIKRYIEFEEIVFVKASAVLSANSGTKYIGFTYANKYKKEEK